MPDHSRVTPGVTRTPLLAEQVPDCSPSRCPTGCGSIGSTTRPGVTRTGTRTPASRSSTARSSTARTGRDGSPSPVGTGCRSHRVTVAPGDVVHVPVGVRHWHGATPHGPWVHLAVTAGGGHHLARRGHVGGVLPAVGPSAGAGRPSRGPLASSLTLVADPEGAS